MYSAAILAGGQSRRFGSDKALYFYKEKVLISWVIDSLVDVEDKYIVANTVYSEFDLKVYLDLISSYGPLSGIYTGLSYAKNDWLAVAACDMPLLTSDYWQSLYKHASDCQAVVIRTRLGLEPLAAFYHRSTLQLIKSQIEKQDYSVQKLLPKLDLKTIDISWINQDPKVLSNFNYLKDFKNL